MWVMTKKWTGSTNGINPPFCVSCKSSQRWDSQMPHLISGVEGYVPSIPHLLHPSNFWTIMCNSFVNRDIHFLSTLMHNLRARSSASMIPQFGTWGPWGVTKPHWNTISPWIYHALATRGMGDNILLWVQTQGQDHEEQTILLTIWRKRGYKMHGLHVRVYRM
jgi:hypothetical protein